MRNDKGANGYVYLGTHKILQRKVALKFYAFEADVHQEVQILAQTKHPNILPVHDAQTVGNGWAYFLTDKSALGDLETYIAGTFRGLRLSVEIIKGILSGVGEMHSRDLVHRDIKPDNILLDSGHVPLIADFGSVKKIPQGAKWVTGSGQAALYRPPETCRDQIYTVASDIYQVGLVLYQLLGGSLPYEAEAWMTPRDRGVYKAISDDFDRGKFVDTLICKRAQAGRLADIHTLYEFVPIRLQSIVRKATASDPAKRFQNCAEFLAALHGLEPLPDWKVEAPELLTLQRSTVTYRIIGSPDGTYTCQKQKGSGKWRRLWAVGKGDRREIVRRLVQDLKM